jgi:hypothetical protein
VLVGKADGIEIRRPIAKQYRIARIVRRQCHFCGCTAAPKFLLRALRKLLRAVIVTAPQFCRPPVAPA